MVAKAWPLILANCSVPLLGLADTAVLGNFGGLYDLGAIALGALIFSFAYWGFGFLRMGTTGFVAQADGNEAQHEVRGIAGQSLALGVGLGLILLLIQAPLATVAFEALAGSSEVETIARSYFEIRIWGAPATLGTFVLVGVLIGLGESRKLLVVQLLLNGLNIGLDIWFAGVLRLGAEGVALGTVIAEWSAFGFALLLVWRLLSARRDGAEPFITWARFSDLNSFRTLVAANSDIMIRTLLLIFSFAWFINQSARYGDTVLAANHVLLQFVSFSAFFLDGFAFVAEALVGQAVGARQRARFGLAVRRTTELALLTALLLALFVWLAGPQMIASLTDLTMVRETAGSFLYLAAIYIGLSFAAFQLDGIFIGATDTVSMRNASVIATAVFLISWWLLAGRFGITGLWWAFIVYVLIRAVALAIFFPRLRARLNGPDNPATQATA